MTVQITILGLGQMGGSIGLALAAHKEKIQRLGHDRDAEVMRSAQKAGAVDVTQINLPRAVENADLVILSLPLKEVQATLRLICADLKPGAVILDLSPARRQAEAWAREILPEDRHYVGIVPAINPARLLETGGGLDGAHDDLFHDAAFLVCPQPGTPESAVRLATDFVLLLGAAPILSDAAEADGLLSVMHTLPKLLAVSLADATMGKPGWEDAKKLTGRAYAMPIASTFDREEADHLCDAALANRDNLVRLLDGITTSLNELREALQANDRDLTQKKLRAAQARAYEWLSENHLEKYYPVDEEGTSLPASFGARLKKSLLGGLTDPDRNP